ncbi:PREDICTED: calmodulin-binding transcription activator 4 isoform X1 [Lupinus angustifolius]|uniref:calmodulin-binding transcription activator 4 isoform X1 n=1 Tax=Lupinus angustifolius TaxID=3871 RepID=UPI00092F0479|nr:PREDICTED: calmodulin-binding transcription activator 4 isoform X1 [Lupinus angustifolius]
MTTTPGFEYNINELYREAQTRWLKPAEVMYILQNHEKYQFTEEAPQQPTSGSLFLFNKRVLRFFRRDGHNWRKKRDGRTVGEAHERLKVGNVEALNCYYAHGEQNPTFQRRSFWMLDPAYDHIVLVHYRETSEGKSSSGSGTQSSPGSSSAFTPSPSSYSTYNPGSTSIHGDSYEPNQSFSSPLSVEVTSDIYTGNNGLGQLDGTYAESGTSTELNVSQALRRLEEQLSLNEDNIKDIPFYGEHETTLDSYPEQNQGVVCKQELFYDGYNGQQGDDGKYYQESLHHNCPDGNKKVLSWTEMLEPSSSAANLSQKNVYIPAINQGNSPSSSRREPIASQENSHWLNFNRNNAENSIFSLPQGVDGDKFPPYSSMVGTQQSNSDYYATLFDQSQIGAPLHTDSSLTVAQNQKFTIKEVSPEWGYTTKTTKVIIVGSFLGHPSDSTWACMFDDVEVPVQIIQDGVIRCEAPPHLGGKVTLCITSGNRESCSEVRQFEYRDKNNYCSHCNSLETEATIRSPEELLLLVRFEQMLLSDSTVKNDKTESGSHLVKQKADDDSWSQIIETLLVGSGNSSSTTDWLLEELLKDKLQMWLSCRSHDRDDETGLSLSKKEQGIIHMVAGLGFEWALNPILSCGVNINFRDISGWTALHWAARFGREKMVASLIASGASAGAVTDPSARDPIGKTAASIASSHGHKGLAGYLSEVALTSHLSSLTLGESELSRSSAEFEADLKVCSVSNVNLTVSEDQESLKDTLAAIRNAAQAAARIQSAFRSHSFRKRRTKEVAAGMGRYAIDAGNIGNIPELSALSKHAFRNSREYDSAALSIQKKYRGWKGRKDFLTLRQKVVKIQAHVRGYQVRKHCKVLWAVGILDKVVLRWRRKGVGLRGFRQDIESIDENEDEDILKVFRKQKVDVEINEAVSRVLSMVDSPNARQQYHRMLEKFHQAKAELASTSEEASLSSSIGDVFNMEQDDMYQFP